MEQNHRGLVQVIFLGKNGWFVCSMLIFQGVWGMEKKTLGEKKNKNNINTPFLFLACLYWCFLFLARKDRSQLPWGFEKWRLLKSSSWIVGAHGHAASRGKKKQFPIHKAICRGPGKKLHLISSQLKCSLIFPLISSHITGHHRID